MSIYISGIGVSKGIAIGEAYLLVHEQLDTRQIKLPKSEINSEIKRFKKALALADKQLHDIKKKIAKDRTHQANSSAAGITQDLA